MFRAVWSVMDLPFTTDQFFAIFAAYNDAVAPFQLVLIAAVIAAAALALRPPPTRWSDGAIGAVLAGLWLWMGVQYHWRFFRAINPAATIFAVAFVTEAALLTWFSVRGRLGFAAETSVEGALGLTLLIYAFVVYPAVGWALGHRYPAAPTFGLPCPTTIATLGLLLWTRGRAPLPVMIVPWAWALIGSVGALQLGVREDLGLPVALAVSLWGWIRSRQQLPVVLRVSARLGY
jgi:uncharacterized protein DUF6064